MELLQTIKNRIALVFPGQGSQYVGMGHLLYSVSPAAKRIFDRADEVLGFSLTKICFEGPQAELDDTYNAQPAILTVSIACLEALRERERLGVGADHLGTARRIDHHLGGGDRVDGSGETDRTREQIAQREIVGAVQRDLGKLVLRDLIAGTGLTHLRPELRRLGDGQAEVAGDDHHTNLGEGLLEIGDGRGNCVGGGRRSPQQRDRRHPR